MSRLISVTCIIFLLFSAYPENNSFEKYKAVEAYEVEPGILAFPTYTEDGQVCEIGIERRHYSPEVVKMDLGLSQAEINKAVDDLAPPGVRGQESDSPFNGLTELDGTGMTAVQEYENVTVQIDSVVKGVVGEAKTVQNVAAVIQWKYRKCR